MINRVILIGRLTKDIDLRKTQSNLSVASFTLAVDGNVKGDDGKYKADFINCIAWRQSADFLAQYASKGMMVGVDGRITTRNYERDGQKVYITEVTCDNVQILESRKEEQKVIDVPIAKAVPSFEPPKAKEEIHFETDALPFY